MELRFEYEQARKENPRLKVCFYDGKMPDYLGIFCHICRLRINNIFYLGSC